MDYNQLKLELFTQFLSEKDSALAERMHQLGITQDGLLSTMSEGKSSDEDWDKTVKYWDEFRANS